MQFSPNNYSRLKSRLRSRYSTRLKKIHKNLDRHSLFYKWMNEHDEEFEEYSPLKWFFIKQLELLSYFYAFPSNYSRKDEFTDLDDEIFEKWNQSEFAQDFLKLLNKGLTVSQASHKTAITFDLHLQSMANRHLLKTRDESKAYRPQTSLGEYVKGSRVSKMLETTLHLEGKELNLMTQTIGEMKNFSTKIEVALRVIRKFSPSSWERFKAFTEVIIPIKQEELVSFSHQELPGTSMINLYNRDFVDLLDDLLHENGHHHLNYYLNLGKLIDEPIENIYYSPWRRTLRPLRGVYHAYFTFFWAFKLFSDIANSKELDSIWYVFSAKEKEKIYWRAVEEYWMLEYTFKDLSWAYKQGLVNETGWDLIKSQRAQLQKFKNKVPAWEKKLRAHKGDLKDLKKKLQQAFKHYRKN